MMIPLKNGLFVFLFAISHVHGLVCYETVVHPTSRNVTVVEKTITSGVCQIVQCVSGESMQSFNYILKCREPFQSSSKS